MAMLESKSSVSNVEFCSVLDPFLSRSGHGGLLLTISS
jgi:hypothetical protein